MTRRKAKLKARVTHLEMTALPAHRVPMPFGPRLAVMRAENMPVHFYRYLYEQVGKPHHWTMRRRIADKALAAAIHAGSTEIEVLYVDGVPAGFFELDLARMPDEAEILYFGLVPDFHGRGLARFFLSAAIFAAWAHEPEKVTIHTNTLDSPRALQLYQKMGFAPVSWSEEEVEPWT
ncbi:GNAT family N-acetyltransferase [Nitratireductor mangrovi]|uniref:GNAT family N-acetyltransferase n=1 Tax=Nitratireductor mangrovi TaxID=2599600 RepID=A0A5B8KVU9_9HYPH|nr:GNAT family N-acetyltransferase [Nitratireductor mangrovi]QDY99680.1 GNAT family N-acetyltransferase [Nitratireductor mangrovi]